MFKKANFEDELYRSMEKQLVSSQVENNHGFNKLAKAVDYLNAAAEIFEQAAMVETATEVNEVLQDLAVEQLTSKAFSVSDLGGIIDEDTMHNILEHSTPAQLMHLGKKVMSFVKDEKSLGEIAEESMKEVDLNDPEVRDRFIKRLMTGLKLAKFFI